MTVKTIYIFRHGQTDYNATRRVMGQLDIPLNESGQHQATELATQMAETAIQAIYSSPLARATQTAQHVADKTGAPIIPNDGLMERNMGDLQGHIVHMADNPADYKMDNHLLELWMPAEWLNNPEWRPDGGESRTDCFRRAQKTIMDIVKNSPYDTIAISTHSGPMRGILELAGDVKDAIGNCDCAKIIFDGKSFTK